MKRTIIIAAIVLLIVIAGAGVYFLVNGLRNATGAPAQTTGISGTLPSTGNQTVGGAQQGASSTVAVSLTGTNTIGTNFGVISNDEAIDYFVNASNVVTEIQPGGEVAQVSGGIATVLSPVQVKNILSASFSYNGAKILVISGNSSTTQASIFDVATKAWTPIGSGWQSAVWSPSDYRIAYRKDNANGTESFATINAAAPKAGATPLITLHAQNLTLAWPAKNQLILQTPPSAAVAGSAWLFTMQNQSLSLITSEAQGLSTIWNSDAGPFGLQFSTGVGNLGGYLSLIDSSGNITQQLKFLTLPSKCAFAAQTPSGATSSVPYLLCGVPRDQTDLAYNHLPDDYNQLTLYTIDNLYRINLRSGAIDAIYNSASQNIDASDIKLFNNILFFINRYDSKLYAVSLSN